MPRELDCPLCGKAFVCERGPGCWCGTIETARAISELAAAGASDCVCRECLVSRTL